MAKDYKITVECDIPEPVAVELLCRLYRSGLHSSRQEITPREIIEDQRELLSLVKAEAKS